MYWDALDAQSQHMALDPGAVPKQLSNRWTTCIQGFASRSTVCEYHKRCSFCHVDKMGVVVWADRGSDKETIPLCPIHHQYGDGSERFEGHIALHRGLESFEKRYGTEQELLAQTLAELKTSEA